MKAQNDNGQAIVDAQNAMTTQHNVLGEWWNANLCLIYEAVNGTCSGFIGPLQEDQTFIPMVLEWPEGQLNLAERIHNIEPLGEYVKDTVESMMSKIPDRSEFILGRAHANGDGLRGNYYNDSTPSLAKKIRVRWMKMKTKQ